jgi:hypothetical protein
MRKIIMDTESSDNKHSKEQIINEKIHLLLEEWKKNVDLYIDHDKRMLQRITIFLVIHGGLLTFYSQVYAENFWLTFIIVAIGFDLTVISKKVSRRAHNCILLRSAQGMFIENALKKIIEGEKEIPWKSLSGIITTFTRENIFSRVHFNEPIPQEWKPLQEESVKDDYVGKIFKKDKRSMGHLDWLNCVYNAVYTLWVLLFFTALFKCDMFLTFLKRCLCEPCCFMCNSHYFT